MLLFSCPFDNRSPLSPSHSFSLYFISNVLQPFLGQVILNKQSHKKSQSTVYFATSRLIKEVPNLFSPCNSFLFPLPFSFELITTSGPGENASILYVCVSGEKQCSLSKYIYQSLTCHTLRPLLFIIIIVIENCLSPTCNIWLVACR